MKDKIFKELWNYYDSPTYLRDLLIKQDRRYQYGNLMYGCYNGFELDICLQHQSVYEKVCFEI